ncbi:radical SAM protein [Myxococcota bacterium]|nr:radical SAM protein [Myxococcota bacterium]MBU1898859.1 radical SAM protein [Myxococcota bacterium]
MAKPKNSFDVMSGIGWRMPRPSGRHLWAWRLAYRALGVARRVRISRRITRVLGPQYRRSRDLIEVDITYACNLSCQNCNRSVSHAKQALHMKVADITRFVDESISRGKRWRRIRILGGEPTLHPKFNEIIEELLRYHAWFPECIVEVVTNGHGSHVQAKLADLPEAIWIDNSEKESSVQPDFGPFNLAPIDDPRYQSADFSNGCAVLRDCGMGLTPLGYYPCAVAGGIDRVLGAGLGESTLPTDDDDMLKATGRLCGLCGRFRDGHFIPRLLRTPLLDEPISPSWRQLYKEWHEARRTNAAESSEAVEQEA